MAERITARVDAATGKFIEDGRPADGRTILEVTVPRNPDVTRDRYSGDAGEPIRAATGEEMATAATAARTAAARKVLAGVPFLADVVEEFAEIVAPLVNKTPAEVVAQMTTGVITRMVSRGA